MLSVAEALNRILALAPTPQLETVPIFNAAGRVLLHHLTAGRSQPPFAASAMDGYAARAEDLADGAVLDVVGESAAGGSWSGTIGPKQALRIFTGAPVPAGADTIVIQEDVTATDGHITLGTNRDTASYIRRAGGDFAAGQVFVAPKRLNPQHIALLAAMNHAQIPVARRPIVALVPTGNELVNVGDTAGPSQIISSNNLGLQAMIEAAGGRARLLPIAPDTRDGLRATLEQCAGADLIITLGGASVGDHDLVATVGQEAGLALDFYKIAMRPGKPLMAGRLNGTPMLGLPGNPVSSMVCGYVFLLPLLRAMLGLPPIAQTIKLPLAHALPANSTRTHYMRANLRDGLVHVQTRQDSSLLSVLADSDCLAIQPPSDPGMPQGALIEVLSLSTIS